MSAPAGRSVTVTRRLPAPPERVFAEWLDAAALADFLAPSPATASILECQPWLGGHLHIVMSDGTETVDIQGEYLELERPSRIRFSWHSDMGAGFDSEVTVTLEPLPGDETLMTIVHELIPDALAGDHEAGWALIAAQLGEQLTSPGQPGGPA